MIYTVRKNWVKRSQYNKVLNDNTFTKHNIFVSWYKYQYNIPLSMQIPPPTARLYCHNNRAMTE